MALIYLFRMKESLVQTKALYNQKRIAVTKPEVAKATKALAPARVTELTTIVPAATEVVSIPTTLITSPTAYLSVSAVFSKRYTNAFPEATVLVSKPKH